jgi:hypothetical protein
LKGGADSKAEDNAATKGVDHAPIVG